jgi:glycosyltransferase involved in cell wall biosynthesis
MHWLVTSSLAISWLIAVFWTLRTLAALRGLPRVPNLLRMEFPRGASDPSGPPEITVIVPARNEAAAIESALRSLLAQTIPVDIIAVDDRSTDETGAIMDRIAAEPQPAGKSLTVRHVEALPAGWLGKPHAIALAARQTATPWLLFTDGDVLFAADVLERALCDALQSMADHLVLLPTLMLRTPGERMMITFFQTLSLLWWRLWRIGNPRTKDSIGIGAFSLIRAEVYRAVGGFEEQRFQVLDDVRLGVEVKRAGYRQRVAIGRDLIRLHWAAGAMGIARNLTKNLFAGFGFQPAMLLFPCLGLALLCYLPLADLFAPWHAERSLIRAAGIVSVVMIVLHYWMNSRWIGGVKTAYVLTMPLAAALVLYAMVRSMVVTMVQGGVVWRGTFYPLRELRRESGRLR